MVPLPLCRPIAAVLAWALLGAGCVGADRPRAAAVAVDVEVVGDTLAFTEHLALELSAPTRTLERRLLRFPGGGVRYGELSAAVVTEAGEQPLAVKAGTYDQHTLTADEALSGAVELVVRFDATWPGGRPDEAVLALDDVGSTATTGELADVTVTLRPPEAAALRCSCPVEQDGDAWAAAVPFVVGPRGRTDRTRYRTANVGIAFER